MTGAGNLFTYYYRNFAVVRATTTKLLDQVYRLRYQVYCIENQFEDPNEHGDERERDEYDAVSAHVLLLHRKSGTAVGTARIIMPQLGSTWRPLPLWQVIAPEVRRDLDRLPWHQTGEISRFAISKEFRRWWRDHQASTLATAGRDAAAGEQQFMQYITFGLIQDILQISIEKRVEYLVASMNFSLMRILSNFGIELERIGGPVEYHGLRQPCIARLADLIELSRSRSAPFWQFVGFGNALSSGVHHSS